MTEHHPEDESENAREERHRRAERRHWCFEKVGGAVALVLTAIAAVGAVASGFATYWAYQETQRTAEAAIVANQIATRPYIKITLEPDTFFIHQPGYSGNDHDVRYVRFLIQNIGKLPGLVAVSSATDWQGCGRVLNAETWASTKNHIATDFIFSDQAPLKYDTTGIPLTKEHLALTDCERWRPEFWVIVDVIYGQSKQYETRVCSRFLLNQEAGGWHLGQSQTYPDEQCNYAK
jgi:hypothetical protein